MIQLSVKCVNSSVFIHVSIQVCLFVSICQFFNGVHGPVLLLRSLTFLVAGKLQLLSDYFQKKKFFFKSLLRMKFHRGRYSQIVVGVPKPFSLAQGALSSHTPKSLSGNSFQK